MKTRHMLAVASILAALTATAQDLNKEITIDRDIVPAQRAAARPMVFPAVTSPAVPPVNLRMEENGSPAAIAPAITPYEPAIGEGAFPLTPYRGYVDLGYFPGVDFGVSAGYAILDKDATRLNAWIQADNRDYKAESGSKWNDFRWKSLDLSGGIGFSQKFGRNTLRLSTDIAFSSWSAPDYWIIKEAAFINGFPRADRDKNLTNLRWHLSADFSGRANDRLTYGVGAGVGIFHNKNQDPGEWIGGTPHFYPLPVNETSGEIHANIRQQISAKAAIGMKVEGNFIRYSSFLTPALMYADIMNIPVDDPGSKTLGQIDFIPGVEYNTGSFYGKAGARLGLSLNSGSSFHVAPDILLGINPGAKFGAWLRLGGGVMPNSLASVFLRSRYADPRLAYDLSNVAFTGQLGLRVGPFKGASLTLTADYAAANDWLMPFQQTDGTRIYNLFAPARIRSCKLGAAIDWQYRSIVAVNVSYEYNPGDDHAWLYWDDRARHVFGASVSVTPITPLTIDLGFTARLDRLQWLESAGGLEYLNSQDYIYNEPFAGSYSLGDLTNLWAGASWRFNSAFTAFARFDNILGKRASLPFNAPSQGFTGLFGVGYKF